MAVGLDTLQVAHPHRGTGPTLVRRRRIVYAVGSGAVLLVMLLAVLDGLGILPVVGVDSRTASTTVGDTRLEVQYPAVARPGVAAPFRVTVTRQGGFDRSVTLAVDLGWLRLWDVNGSYPAPASETGDPEWVVWTFDPPEGDRFTFTWDGRIEPAQQAGRTGAVEVRDGSTVVARVDYRTRVMP